MRSAHVFYRAMTAPAEVVEGTDGILIVSAFNEFHEASVVMLVGAYVVLLAALACAAGHAA